MITTSRPRPRLAQSRFLQQARTTALASVLAAASMPASADDTDIYINPAKPVTEQPLVMFSLDYRANLTSPAAANVESYFRAAGLGADVDELKIINDTTEPKDGADAPLYYFDTLILSLKLVLSEITGVKIGFMMSHGAGGAVGYKGESPSTSQRDSNGAAILYGFNTLNDANTLVNFKKKLLAVKKLKPQSNSPDHSYQGAEVFFEFFRYLTGGKVFNGHNGWVDFEQGSSVDKNTNMRCTHADSTINPACWDKSIEDMDLATSILDPVPVTNPASTPPNYVTPLKGIGSCAKIFTINFLFQVTQQDNDSNTAIAAAKSSGGMGFNPGTSSAFENVLAFMRDADLADGTFGTAPNLAGKQNVTSYFIVDPSKVNNTTIGYARAGGTENPLELASDPGKLVETLRNVFKQILSVSTTFVAASAPVNVFNRAEIVDNVYFALFQAEGKPRWKGNLKKLRLSTEDVLDQNGTVVGKRTRIVDNQPTPQDAIGADGRIVFNALTHWTDNSNALLDLGDSNGDGAVDAKDTNSPADGLANNVDTETGQVTFPTPSTGVAANLPNYITDRDGRHIPRGGAGQKIPGFMSGTAGPGDTNPTGNATLSGPRKLFYLSSSPSAASLQPLNVTAAPSAELKTQLGNASMSDAEAQKLLRYARGQDATDIDADCGTDTSPTATCRTEARHWMLGDPLHSRPLPINYGLAYGHTDPSKPAIFIAMASNDGYLRMFRNTTAGDASTSLESGQEVWAFMPPEGMAIQRRLVDNSVPPGESPHPYSFDGESTALMIDLNGNGTIDLNSDPALSDRVILYIGLRRGGSAYYALDVSDPLNPKFLWRITPTSRTTTAGEQSTTDFAEMGQTFSRPRVGRLNLGTETGGASRIRLAVFFGGGYDGGYGLDSSGNTIRLGKDRDGVMANDSKGQAIYAVRANDASLIWKAVKGTGAATSTVFQHPALNDSIPSNLTILDTDADGTHDRIYVGDTGGTLWRVDMGPDNDGLTNPTQAQITDDWTLTRLACLGRHSGADCSTISTRLEDRRFFHEPDVVQAFDETGRFDAVVIGSGDREDPLDQGGDVDNWFYMIKDRVTAIGGATNRTLRHSDLTDVTNACLGGSPCTISGEGWRLALDNPNGEKALSAPITIANSIFFTTYLPPGASTNTCGPGEGSGFLYALKLDTGAPARNYNASDDGGSVNPDGSGTTDSDRQKDLETPGIPAQVVYIGAPPGGGASGGTCTVNILAGARIFEAPGCPRFRTFWQRLER